jgi:hypothetical protein
MFFFEFFIIIFGTFKKLKKIVRIILNDCLFKSKDLVRLLYRAAVTLNVAIEPEPQQKSESS